MATLEKLKTMKTACMKFFYWVESHDRELMLFLTVLATMFAFFSAIFSYAAIQEARESTKLAEISTKLAESNVNKTTDIAEWYYNPKPQMSIWTSVDYELNKSGFVYVNEWFDYNRGKGFEISNGTLISGYYGFKNTTRFYQAPTYLACCKAIKISVYNSGRGSIVFPLISFDIEAKNKSNGILFKVHTVRTPIDKLEYNPELKLMFESQEFIENQKIEMPYNAINDDFPPYLDEGGNSYFVPPSFSKEFLPYNSYTPPWKERSEMLGPFRIGTIPPGGSVEIELKIFATEENCNEGFLNITVEALNTDMISKIVNLKTGSRDTCKRIEETKLETLFLIILNEHNAARNNLNSGDYNDALNHSKNAINAYEESNKKELLSPEDVGKLYWLAAASAERLEDYKLAYEYAKKSIDADSSSINNANFAFVLYKLGEYREASEYIEKALLSEPNNPQYLELKKEILKNMRK